MRFYALRCYIWYGFFLGNIAFSKRRYLPECPKWCFLFATNNNLYTYWVNSSHLLFSILFNFNSIEWNLNRKWTEIEQNLNENWGRTCDYIQVIGALNRSFIVRVLNTCSISVHILFSFCLISVQFPFNFHSIEWKLNMIEKTDDLNHSINMWAEVSNNGGNLDIWIPSEIYSKV